MKTPQLTFLILILVGLLIAANQHGKERKPTDFWTTLIATLLQLTILYWGGFFD
jgi:hypothetical protein